MKKIAAAHFSDKRDSLLIIQSAKGINIGHADTFIVMRTFPDLLFLDQIVSVTALVDSTSKEGIPELQIIHPEIHLRTLTNYYCLAGLVVMVFVLFFWFLYERRNYRRGIHMTGQKTLNVVMLSISATIIVSAILGFILFNLKGEYSIPSSPARNLVYAGITYISISVLQFVIMVVVVQLLQNKYVSKKHA